MRKLLTLSAIIISPALVLLTACGAGQSVATNTIQNVNQTSANNVPVTTDSAKAFSIEFKSEPAQIQANQPATLSFTVKDKQGAIVKDLQTVHEKPMHLLVVSKDLAEFYHIHPEQTESDGSYRVQTTFPNGGEYKLYADFTPKDAAQVVEQVDVKVAGQERARVPMVADEKFEKVVDGLRVVMKPEGELKAGNELTLNFQAFDAASGKPAADLQNYLGELAHFVIISEDMKDFVHAHPMSKGEHDGMKTDDHSSGEHKHSTMEGATTKPSASEVAAHTAFPRSGLYKAWAQFQRGGKVITVPFVVNSAERNKNMSENKTSDFTGAIKVTVSSGGYEPSSIPVKKGQPVKLAFTRTDANNCGGEVVFSKLNIKKQLPVGETVLVEISPLESGEISFACGMDMMQGKIIIQ